MTWAQAAKAFKRIQEAERSAPAWDGAAQKKPEIIDADFREIEDSGEPEPATIQEAGAGEGPEGYTHLDVALLLDKYSRNLTEYRKCFAGDECPPPLLKKQRILVDALGLLNLHLKEESA